MHPAPARGQALVASVVTGRHRVQGVEMGTRRHGVSLPLPRCPVRPGRSGRAPPLRNAGPVNGVLTSLALVLVFVLIGGYFSGSELAVVSRRDSQVDRLPGKRGDRVRKLRVDSNRFLASVQVGVTFAGFFASAYGGSTLSEPLGNVLVAWGVPVG